MSNQALTWAFNQEDLPCKAKFVLVSIANHADHTNGYCWLKIATIADETGIPERSLYRYLGALVRNGYLRREKKKGADGKQRANDYWIIFDRPAAPFEWGAVVGGDDDAEPQDDVEPTATMAPGETDLAVGDEPKKMHDLAPGPTAIGGSASDAEPPKIKSKDSSSQRSQTPRGYRAPPPVPQGASAGHQAKPIFVYVGTDAWNAWMAERKRLTGYGSCPTTSRLIDGKLRQGWDFPTLYPAKTAAAQAPPTANTSSDQSEKLNT
jgi:hypothetical protein